MKTFRLLLIVILSIIGFIISFDSNAQTSGKASYYSNALHGRRMSNGQPYNKNDFTCAHRTLPFGTRLKVTNTRNGKSVIVRVTDRGPFTRGRIVDLSYAAAKAIGMITSGVGYVHIEMLRQEAEIPYPIPEEEKPIEVPEIEYGMAGVCIEFIPEWEKPKEDKPAEIERKVKPRNTPKKSSSSPQTQKKTTNTQQQTASTKSSTEGDSKSWTDFFNNLKNGVTEIFE